MEPEIFFRVYDVSDNTPFFETRNPVTAIMLADVLAFNGGIPAIHRVDKNTETECEYS